MRSVLQSDVVAAARALRAVAASERTALCAKMLREAETADRYTRQVKQTHPLWGGGTLREVAMHRLQVPEPSFDDPDYCACVTQLMEQLCLRPRSRHL